MNVQARVYSILRTFVHNSSTHLHKHQKIKIALESHIVIDALHIDNQVIVNTPDCQTQASDDIPRCHDDIKAELYHSTIYHSLLFEFCFFVCRLLYCDIDNVEDNVSIFSILWFQ